MTSKDLKEWQGEQIAAVVGPLLGYLHRLSRRMDRVSWDPTDKFYKTVMTAYGAIHSLNVELYYLGLDAAKREREAAGGPPKTGYGV